MTYILSLLEKIQNNSQQLFDCLQQEKAALDENQLDKLNDISAQKQKLLTHLGELDKQRIANSSSENFNAFIANTHDKKLIHQWKQTRQAIANCQKQNDINGRLLNRRTQVNKEILSVISGRELFDDTTYNASGDQTQNTSLLSGVKA